MLKALHTLNKHDWIDFVEYIQLVEVLDIMWALEINALDFKQCKWHIITNSAPFLLLHVRCFIFKLFHGI